MTTARPSFRGRDRPEAFREVLASFKRRGCNLLVTGEVGVQVTRRATRKLLGSARAERSRVLVVAGPPGGAVTRYLPGGVRPADESLALIDHPCGCRGPVEATADTGRVVDEADLDSVAAAVEDAVGALAPAAGYGPAELRLSVTSLPALLDRYGAPAVERFADRIAENVAAHDGMAHYHLPVPDDAAVVSRLADGFDARIELREESGALAEQRWHVPGHGTTDWVTL